MCAATLRCGLLLAFIFAALSATSIADELSQNEIKSVMAHAEILLGQSGINVVGYKDSPPPKVELVSSEHIFLQGNDGAYVAGRIYLNSDGIPGCRDLNLLHETVHDATIRFGLFKTVNNAEIRRMIEALADEIIQTAAENPYRPGCVTHRRVDISTAELVSLAVR